MCDYCNKENTEIGLSGSDGIIYDEKKNRYYLFIEHFKGECNRIYDPKYCLQCGEKLN